MCVRVPKWADKRELRCRVNQTEIARHWAGNYLLITDLARRDLGVVEFPVVETVEKAYGSHLSTNVHMHFPW
jgi:hypothetical protein